MVAVHVSLWPRLHMQARYTHKFSAEMHAQATSFYFNHYREHFSTPLLAPVMACIPQVSTSSLYTP